jgi:hypothetical protein
VSILKQQKIDLSEKYPCPCCRGQLQQIVLTEAFGCDRCQKIFALQSDGLGIEQTSSPYESCWQWNGKKWQVKSLPPRGSWVALAGLALAILIILSSWQIVTILSTNREPTTGQKSKY